MVRATLWLVWMLVWMLATEFGSSGRAASALSGWAIAPAPAIITFDYGLLFPTKSSSSLLRKKVSLFRVSTTFCISNKKRNGLESTCFPCGSQKEIHLAVENPMECVAVRSQRGRCTKDAGRKCVSRWSCEVVIELPVSWSSVATTRDSRGRQVTVLLYFILLN